MSKLNANFVVNTSSVEFKFSEAEKASRFSRAVAKYSARMYRRLAGTTGELGPSPCIGSDLNAFPILEDGSQAEHGLTLGTTPNELKFVEKKQKGSKAPAAPKAPRRGRKAAEDSEDGFDNDTDE